MNAAMDAVCQVSATRDSFRAGPNDPIGGKQMKSRTLIRAACHHRRADRCHAHIFQETNGANRSKHALLLQALHRPHRGAVPRAGRVMAADSQAPSPPVATSYLLNTLVV
jgi:hypothetical protein